MNSILEYPFMTPYSVCIGYIDSMSEIPLIMKRMLNGKIAENPVVTPSSDAQIVEPSGVNRYLQSVVVSGVVPVTKIISISGTNSYTTAVAQANSVVSETTSIATATITNSVITITGVAAGTTTVRCYDSTENLVGLIVVTVTS